MKIKPLLTLALSLAVTAAVLTAPPARAGVNDFTVPVFESDYYLSRDRGHISHLRVHEHLIVQFPDFDQNHGILRAIPSSYESHGLNLQIQAVTDNGGRPVNYTSSSQNGNLILKINDPAAYVHGQQTYNLDYTMDNVTTVGAGYNGLFWDINGIQWSQPFDSVIARFHLAGDLAPALTSGGSRCFTGANGSEAQNCLPSATAPGSPETQITFATTRGLGPNENLTTELRFTPGTFVAYKMPPGELSRLISTIFFLYLLPGLLTLIIVIRQWRKYGRDPKDSAVIIAQYLPPKALSVLGSSGLLQEKFDPQAVSAQIIDLAVRHYFKIYETKENHIFKDKTVYEIELVRDPGDLRTEELAVVQLLFGANPPINQRVNLETLKNKLFTEAKTIGDNVTQQLANDGFFRRNPVDAKLPYLTAGGVLLILAFFLRLPLLYGGAFIIPSLILLVGAKIMPARTQLGVDSRDYLLGLKLYMKMAEADRLNMLQSPHGELTEKIDVSNTTALVKLYERLLPYAMLFSIEKDWAKEFAGLYQQPPDWYAGSAAFNAGYFVGSISGFAAASTASFSPPSSSSGGGFSGGGGGGGGGGGW